MLPLYKSFLNKCFKAHQMIGSAVPFMETTLNRREQFIFLQVPDLIAALIIVITVY